jgi:antitoxin component YwqK of YwqJK toxin-antitoxin module
MLFKEVSLSNNFLFCNPFSLSAAVLGFTCACTELTIIKSSIIVILTNRFINNRFDLIKNRFMQILKIRQLWLFTILQLLFLMNGLAQYRTYKLSTEGDTLNAIDNKGMKQGKWVIHVEALRGEPGYEEEGLFKNNNKEGVWRQYSLQGDIIAVEFYKLGGKHGVQQYYTYLGDLIREESWRGYDPEAPYDTVAVYGEGNNEIIDYKITKAEQYSVRHGEWKYYEAGTGRLVKVEKYDRGSLENPGGNTKTAAATPAKKKEVEKTPQMLEWEKKNKGKKNVVRDGRTNAGG